MLGKAAQWLTQTLNRRGGTALPGLLALKIDPELVGRFAADSASLSIVITGTNGKTTTTRALGAILSHAGLKTISNRSGSNLERGIASAIVRNWRPLHRQRVDFSLWELDEAAFPLVIRKLNPKIVILTNLFRDQLDRYGEIDTLIKKWKTALESLPPHVWIILNEDDPNISALVGSKRKNTLRYGAAENLTPSKNLPHASESVLCPRCHHLLEAKFISTAHYGRYNCLNCKFKNDNLSTKILAMKTMKTEAGSNKKMTQMTIIAPGGKINISTTLPGMYNVYNLAAVVSAAQILKLPATAVKETLRTVKAPFGRGEVIEVKNRRLQFFLAKNPAGLNEIISTLTANPEGDIFLFALNDGIADGTDVSWIWDSDYEKLIPLIRFAVVTGTRAEDLALRLKYAGLEPNRWSIEKDQKQALKRLVQKTPKDHLAYVIPTYTAMLRLREILAGWGVAHSVWHD
jgi:UDP-N-acetylmuramyl tripeptide synthase